MSQELTIHIKGLYGGKELNLTSVNGVLQLKGLNGTCKSTILKMVYYLLSGQISQLLYIPFDEIKIHTPDHRVKRIDYEQVLKEQLVDVLTSNYTDLKLLYQSDPTLYYLLIKTYCSDHSQFHEFIEEHELEKQIDTWYLSHKINTLIKAVEEQDESVLYIDFEINRILMDTKADKFPIIHHKGSAEIKYNPDFVLERYVCQSDFSYETKKVDDFTIVQNVAMFNVNELIKANYYQEINVYQQFLEEVYALRGKSNDIPLDASDYHNFIFVNNRECYEQAIIPILSELPLGDYYIDHLFIELKKDGYNPIYKGFYKLLIKAFDLFQRYEVYKNEKIIQLETLLNEYFHNKKVTLYPTNMMIRDKQIKQRIPLDQLSSSEANLIIVLCSCLFVDSKCQYLLFDQPHRSMSTLWQESLHRDLNKLAINLTKVVVSHTTETLETYF